MEMLSIQVKIVSQSHRGRDVKSLFLVSKAPKKSQNV